MSLKWQNRFTITPAQNRLAVVDNVWYRSAGANPFFDRWVMAEWLGRWLQQWGAKGVTKILEFTVQHWHPPHEAIRS